MRELIKLKTIHELLESISDRCEDVAKLIKGVVLENSRSPHAARAIAEMDSDQTAFWVVELLVVLAVAFDFINGFNDAANWMATVASCCPALSITT